VCVWGEKRCLMKVCLFTYSTGSPLAKITEGGLTLDFPYVLWIIVQILHRKKERQSVFDSDHREAIQERIFSGS
jgi:hypothetical protein